MDKNAIIEEFNGKKYKKVFDDPKSNPSEYCEHYCCFSVYVDEGKGFPKCYCMNPGEDRFNGCAAGHFHWEIVNE